MFIIIIIIIIITANDLLPGGKSPYTSTRKTKKNKIYLNKTIQKHSKYKYTYYQNTNILQKHTYTHTHILEQDKRQMK
jgi:hypothetical protein